MSVLSRHEPGDAVAFAKDRTITAAELRAHVSGFADLLAPAEGEQDILVICRDRYRFCVATLACWKRGYAVALPPSPQLETIRAIRLREGVATVIHDVDGVDRGIDVRDARVVAAARDKVGRVPFSPLTEVPPERRLATVYTSGSSGEHVACPKTAGQLLGEAATLAATFSIPRGARVAPMVPPHHIYGLLFGVLVPLVSGASFYRGTPLHVPEVLAALVGGVDVLVTVPAHLRGLLVAKPGELPPVPRVFSSAAPLSPRVAAGVRERFGWTISEVFGSSETGGIGWRESGGEGPWTPLAGVEVGESDDGRMTVRSPFVHPREAQPYVAADRVRALPDGRFEHLGRADGVLKIGGVRVSLAEVERRLHGIDGVRDAAVLAVDVGGARGHEIWAAVVAPGMRAEMVRRALRAWLVPVAMPRRLKLVDALPRTEAGKLPRAALEALFARAEEEDA